MTAGNGVDIALDAVGGALFEPCMKSLCHGGRQIAIAGSPQVVSFNLVDFYHGANRLIGVDSMALTGREIAALMDRLRAGFEGGFLEPPPVQTWPFEHAINACQAVAKGGAPVKHVLLME